MYVQRLCASICSVDTCRAVLPARARAVWTRERTRMRALLFSCPDSHGSVRATHRSVPRHRIARSGLAIESNRLCDVDRNRSDGVGWHRDFGVRPSPKCPVKTQPASYAATGLLN